MNDNMIDTYIIFDLAGETYGTPLLSVREIVEMQAIKPVPYAPPHYLGVLNLRGQIISVIDLRTKFGLSYRKNENHLESGFIMILDLMDSTIGVRVDKVNAVKQLESTEVSYSPVNNVHIDPAYLQGVSRIGDDLACLVHLSKLISGEELENIKMNQSA